MHAEKQIQLFPSAHARGQSLINGLPVNSTRMRRIISKSEKNS
ncbi:hypothetical protein SS05631_c38330 [Sinorhizobium sp. CCBAU 05631]|nr:hypothetical protein SS05631_c38330 [Sinorhizobium sp. CCBAU 05631]